MHTYWRPSSLLNAVHPAQPPRLTCPAAPPHVSSHEHKHYYLPGGQTWQQYAQNTLRNPTPPPARSSRTITSSSRGGPGGGTKALLAGSRFLGSRRKPLGAGAPWVGAAAAAAAAGGGGAGCVPREVPAACPPSSSTTSSLVPFRSPSTHSFVPHPYLIL